MPVAFGAWPRLRCMSSIIFAIADLLSVDPAAPLLVLIEVEASNLRSASGHPRIVTSFR
jgi:hypothetical protein